MYAAALKDLKARCLLARPDCDILASIPADHIFGPALDVPATTCGFHGLHYAYIRGSCQIVSDLGSHPGTANCLP